MYSVTPPKNDLVKVSSMKHILGETEKALHLRIGQTLYGEPITAFFPKSACKTRPDGRGNVEIYVPAYMLRRRESYIGNTAHNHVGSYEGFADWSDADF